MVQLGELAPFVRRGESLELAQGLASEVAAVHEEQDLAAPRRGLIRRYAWLQAMKVLPLPVAICTNARGRPAAQRLLQVPDRPFLCRPEA